MTSALALLKRNSKSPLAAGELLSFTLALTTCELSRLRDVRLFPARTLTPHEMPYHSSHHPDITELLSGSDQGHFRDCLLYSLVGI